MAMEPITVPWEIVRSLKLEALKRKLDSFEQGAGLNGLKGNFQVYCSMGKMALVVANVAFLHTKSSWKGQPMQQEEFSFPYPLILYFLIH